MKDQLEEKCYSCGGKGTYSQIHGIHGSEDFGGDGFDEKPAIHNYPCKACEGTGLKLIPVIETEAPPEVSEKKEECACISSEVCVKCCCKKCFTYSFETGRCDCPISSPQRKEVEVSEWAKTFEEILKKHDCWNLNLELDLLRHMEFMLQKCREATLEEAAEALEKIKAPTKVGWPFPPSDHEKYRNKVLSSAQSTIRALKK